MPVKKQLKIRTSKSKKTPIVTFKVHKNSLLPYVFINGKKVNPKETILNCRKIAITKKYVLKIDGTSSQDFYNEVENQTRLEIKFIKTTLKKEDEKFFPKIYEYGRIPKSMFKFDARLKSDCIPNLHYILEERLRPLPKSKSNFNFKLKLAHLEKLIERYNFEDMSKHYRDNFNYTVKDFKHHFLARNWMIDKSKQLKIFDFAL